MFDQSIVIVECGSAKLLIQSDRMDTTPLPLVGEGPGVSVSSLQARRGVPFHLDNFLTHLYS